MDIIKAENLTKTYGSGDNAVRALDNVSFSVEKGEFVGSAFAYAGIIRKPEDIGIIHLNYRIFNSFPLFVEVPSPLFLAETSILRFFIAIPAHLKPKFY